MCEVEAHGYDRRLPQASGTCRSNWTLTLTGLSRTTQAARPQQNPPAFTCFTPMNHASFNLAPTRPKFYRHGNRPNKATILILYSSAAFASSYPACVSPTSTYPIRLRHQHNLNSRARCISVPIVPTQRKRRRLR